MAHAAHSPAGNRVGHYQLLEQIGAGGMGRVFQAFDTSLERTVALKFLNPDPGGSQAERERLLREARAASVLDHRNIAAIHAVEQTEDGQLFIVMAYCEGETLSALLRRGPLQPVRAITLACQIARGLEHAHAHGIIHRDIKPSNVILAPDGVARIVDFGLARRFTPSETQSGMVGGTLSYMSPEQVSGAPADARSDIWSLGVMLYEMLSGRLPFAQPSAGSTVLAILHAAPAPLESVPEGLELVIYRALAKTAGARYQSCTELLHDLEALTPDDRQPTEALEPRDLRRRVRRAARELVPRERRRLALWAAAGLTAVVLAGVFTFSGPVLRGRLFHSATAPPTDVNSPAYESYRQGRDLLQRFDKPGNLENAIARLQEATLADPQFALSFAALGEAYWYKYRLDLDTSWLRQAEAFSKQALQMNNQLPAVHVTLGRIHSVGNETELALQEFQRALQLDPLNADALRGTAGIYERLGRRQDAEDLYRRAIILQPDSWLAGSDFGTFYFRHGENQKAEQQYRRAVELAPDNAIAHGNLALALDELERPAEAEAEFRKSIELRPTYRVYAMLGRFYFRQRRWADAAATVEKALELNPNDYRVWANLAGAYEWQERSADAERAYAREFEQLQAAAKIAPQDPEIQCFLGVFYAKQGQRERALPHLEAALARAPDRADVLGNAAEAYDYLGERERALDLIRRALQQGLAMGEIERDPGLRSLRQDPRFPREGAMTTGMRQ